MQKIYLAGSLSGGASSLLRLQMILHNTGIIAFINMNIIWDIMFGTYIITRKYPTYNYIKHYKEEEWYAQFLWPIFKSKKEGSELSPNGPMVGDAVETKEIKQRHKGVIVEEEYV